MILARLLRTSGIALPRLVRHKSILSSLESSRILISSSTDVYTNLAIEHWLYTNLRFKSENKQGNFISPVVFLWINSPSIVVGKHQNPWVESTLGFVELSGIKLARRFSGGGCVYHDENNINISIIGDRDVFGRRKENLEFLAQILRDKYALEFVTSPRYDLRQAETELKISGSASRLGTQNSYHHFTLLVDSDKDVMRTAIRQKDQEFIQSSSTTSIRSDVVNLLDLKSDLNTEKVLSDLAIEYGKIYEAPSSKKIDTESATALGDEDHASLTQVIDKLKSWEWIYGQTPRFKLERAISLSEDGIDKQVRFIVHVNKGRFEKFSIEGDMIKTNPEEKFSHLIGVKFNYKESVPIIARMFQSEDEVQSHSESIGIERVLATLLLQMIHGANY